MTKDDTARLELLLQILRGGAPAFEMDEETWLALIQTASRQTVTGLLYKAAERFPRSPGFSERVLFTLMREVNIIVNRNRLLGEVEKEVLGVLCSGGLHPVVMKGSTCAARYPSPELRTGGDIDIFLPGEAEFRQAVELLGGLGAECTEKPDSSACFYLRGCEVELHRKYFDLHVRESLLPPVGTPEAELLMLSAHILKHACGVGVGLRQIMDFALAYKAYPGDYKQLDELFRSCRLSRWNALLLSFVKDYIDPATYTPGHVDSRSLFNIVAEGGNFGHFLDKRLESVQEKPAFRRKIDTFRRFLCRLPFSLRYAPRETLSLLTELFRENLH